MSYSFLGGYGCSQTHWNLLINPIVAHFALRMRSLHIHGDVSLMNNPTYTQATYMRSKAEYVNCYARTSRIGVSSYSLYATHYRASGRVYSSTRELSGYVQTKLTQLELDQIAESTT
jgi:hypothetical protein